MLKYYISLILITFLILIIKNIQKNNRYNKNRKNNRINTNNYKRTYKHEYDHRHTYSARKKDKYEIRGEYGERELYKELDLKIPGEKYILTNLYTFKDNNRRNEIDLLLIHQTGFYVIESKNYSGYISGNRYQKEWIQTFYSKNKKYSKKFYNPINQNFGHISTLKKMLGMINQDYFKSYIAFGNKAKINHVLYSDKQIKITNYANIANHIIDDIMQSPNLFSKEQIYLYYYKLKPFCHKNDDVTEKHIQALKNDNSTKV